MGRGVLRPGVADVRLRDARADADLPWIMALERREDFRALLCASGAEAHAARLADPDCRYLIVEDEADGTRQGFAILRGLTSAPRAVELVRVALAEPGRGAGRSVLRELVGLCFNELGARRLWLDVFDDNERARRAYQAVGFREEGRSLTTALRQDGSRGSLLVMAIAAGERPGG